MLSFSPGGASTTRIYMFSSVRLVRARIYFVLGAVPQPVGSGYLPSPTISWITGSSQAVDEGKVESKASVVSYQDVGGHMTLTPTSGSLHGFWFNYSSSGDVFQTAVPAGVSAVLDITLDYTVVDGVNQGVTFTGPATTSSGIYQRGKTNWAPVGYAQS